MLPHIKKIYDKAKTVRLFSKEYWEMRARHREKMDDPTYMDDERKHSFHIWKILTGRNK